MSTTITPPPPPTSPPPPSGGQPVLTVEKPPPQLQQIPAGTRLEVTITDILPKSETAPKPAITLQLPAGKVTVETPLPLPKGALLNLVVQPQGAKVQLLLQSINGEPAQSFLKNVASPQAPAALGGTNTISGPAGAGTPLPPLPTTPVTVGEFLSATLLRPATFTPLTSPTGQPLQAPTGQSPSPQGQPGTGTQSPTGSPAGQPGQVTPGTIPGQASPGQVNPGTISGQPYPGQGQATPTTNHAIGQSGQPPQPGLQAGSPLPTGTGFSVQITAVANQPGVPVQATGPAATGIGQGQVLTGTVSGTTTIGQPIVQSQHGVMSLNTSAPIQSGTSLAFEIKSPPVLPQESATTGGTFSRETLVMGRHWHSLTEAVQTLKQASPEYAQHVTNNILPKPDSQLAAHILMFIGALKGGEIKNWMGEGALRALDRVRSQSAKKAGDEFKMARQIAEEPNKQDWRITMIPLLNGHEVEKIRLMTRNPQEEEDDEEKKNKGTRFVLDIDLSRLGHVQLDGLANGPEKKLDLIIRSDEPLTDKMQNDIRDIFTEANRLTGVSGGISFQSKPAKFVDITTVPKDDMSEGVTV